MHIRTGYLILLASLGLTACQQTVDVAAEEAAIKAVCQGQLDAALAWSYDGEAATWAHEPYIVRKTANSYIKGWDSLSVFYQKRFKQAKELYSDRSKYNREVFTASNFDIQLKGDMAIVFYDQHAHGIWDGEKFSNDSRSLKYLEKKDGDWRIVAVLGNMN